MNYGRFIGQLSSRRRPSLIRELTRMMTDSDLIPLSAGMPNPELFPFKKTTFTLQDKIEISLEGLPFQGALQYQATNGMSSLLAHIKNLQRVVHNSPVAETSEILILAGSQDGLCKSLEMLLEPNKSSVITEEFVYSGTLAIMDPYQPSYIVIKSDEEGMIPESLHSTLQSKWPSQEAFFSDESAPKFIYINPTGANPTGSTLSLERRKEIYKIATEYDLLILEDDPYYYLQLNNQPSLPSFLSLDTTSRVLRFDSFSKILSSGMRLGFLTGPKALTNQIALHMQASVLHASSLSQTLTAELLTHWQIKGFNSHVKQVQDFYAKRRDLMHEAAIKRLTGLCTWSLPTAGMFFWFKVHGVKDTFDMIMKRGIEKKISLVPGGAFMPNYDGHCPYMRASFSLTDVKNFDVAFSRLAQLIEEEQKQSQSSV